MAVTVTLDLRIKTEKLDEFKVALKAWLPDTRAYSGCRGVDVHEDLDKPGHLFLVQLWDSREHQQKYVAWRTETGVMETFLGFLAVEPTFTYYDNLDI